MIYACCWCPVTVTPMYLVFRVRCGQAPEVQVACTTGCNRNRGNQTAWSIDQKSRNNFTSDHINKPATAACRISLEGDINYVAIKCELCRY